MPLNKQGNSPPRPSTFARFGSSRALLSFRSAPHQSRCLAPVELTASLHPPASLIQEVSLEALRDLPHGLQYRWSHLAQPLASPRHRRRSYEQLHAQFAAQAWLIGRVTGQEFAKAKEYPNHTPDQLPREPWFATRDASTYAVVLDAQGKIAWGRSDIGGDPIVVVLTEAVSDAHLAGLRTDNVSYFLRERRPWISRRALESLHRELGVQRLLLEGGGIVNGSFLRAAWSMRSA